MAGDPCSSGFGPLGQATPAGTFYPPPKKIHGAAIGVSEAVWGCPQEKEPILG